jgi:hypothetical protein
MAAANRMHDLMLARQWIHYVHLSDVMDWASQEGLNAIKHQTYRRLFYNHELVLFRRPG